MPQISIIKKSDVQKMLELNKQLQSIPENSDKWNLAKKEIEKTDREIDEIVYRLHELKEKKKNSKKF